MRGYDAEQKPSNPEICHQQRSAADRPSGTCTAHTDFSRVLSRGGVISLRAARAAARVCVLCCVCVAVWLCSLSHPLVALFPDFLCGRSRSFRLENLSIARVTAVRDECQTIPPACSHGVVGTA